MNYLTLDAPPLFARSESTLRPVARRIAHTFRPPSAELATRAALVAADALDVGHVHSGGPWNDARVHREIVTALDAPLRPGLRKRFEWYLCRGAFFHTDAHYADVLFGIWYVLGPEVDIVFPRGRRRIVARPGTLVVFDPFEVHGVLRPGTTEYCAEDHADSAPSVFVGFEVEFREADVADFDMAAGPHDARVVSSSTRISAATGAFE
jgi:hypothetical protein